MKTAKVFAFYFGDRRHYPHNKDGVTDLFYRQIESHEKIDPGTPMDLIIVNHDSGDESVRELLNRYEGYTIKNGIVKIIHRPRINYDLSMGSYKYAFFLLHDQYDYWFFCEDDIEELKNDTVKKMIDLYESDKNIGFVAACDYVNYDIHRYKIKDGYIDGDDISPAHAHGGIGLTSTSRMKYIAEKFPYYLNTPNIEAVKNSLTGENVLFDKSYIDENFHEIDFTNVFVKAGYKLKSFSDGTNFLHIRENMIL